MHRWLWTTLALAFGLSLAQIELTKFRVDVQHFVSRWLVRRGVLTVLQGSLQRLNSLRVATELAEEQAFVVWRQETVVGQPLRGSEGAQRLLDASAPLTNETQQQLCRGVFRLALREPLAVG